ncbi:MAG: GNAT family N-acetyltransferase [Chloroflexota bacterium]
MTVQTATHINGVDIVLRPIRDTDMPFLLELYASTRAEEMAMIDWPDEQKDQFLATQFHAQHTYYMENYLEATFDVMIWQKEPIGRLYVEEWPTELRIIDIALLPQYRKQGIGGYFMKKLMQRAQDGKKGVSIHVEKNNPAMRLYKRLGFKKVDEHGLYDLMGWRKNDK